MSAQNHIAYLIPTTSQCKPLKAVHECTLYQKTLSNLINHYDRSPKFFNSIFIGYDHDDKFFDNSFHQEQIRIYMERLERMKVYFIKFPEDLKRGHLTRMWNVLAKAAYECETPHKVGYMFQVGDDMGFKTHGWENECIHALEKNDGIGLTGPVNNNAAILTQCFVSRKHYEIFDFFFPEELINWGCDDWINLVYKPNHFFPLKNHVIINEGGNPKYVVDNDKKFLVSNKNYQMQKANQLRKKAKSLADELRHKIPDLKKSDGTNESITENSSTTEDVSGSASA